jgi:hypothetical protein
MRDCDIWFVPVCDSQEGMLAGTLTDRDSSVRLAASEREPKTPVQDIVTGNAIFCHDDDDVNETRELMESP